MAAEAENPHAPFVVSEDADDQFSVIVNDWDFVEVAYVFEDAGFTGNGYDWEGLARAAVAAYAPDLDDAFDYDSEAGMFVAYTDHPDLAARLATLLHDLFHDRAALAALIADADPALFDG